MPGSAEAFELSVREKFSALADAARYRPVVTAAVAVFSVLTALLEAVGLSFIVPIVEIAQSDGTAADGGSRLMELFVAVYRTAGIPLTLEAAIAGVIVVMFARYTASFLVSWSRQLLQEQYRCDLQARTFEHVLDARVSYFDNEGSENILNAVITQTKYASNILRQGLALFQNLVLAAVYLGIGLYLAPVLTLITIIVFSGLTFVIRYVLEPGESVGDRVADANERIQTSVQVGIQGIRDVKLFRMTGEVLGGFHDAINQYVNDKVKLARNNAFISNFYQFAAAVAIFTLIYAALTFTS